MRVSTATHLERFQTIIDAETVFAGVLANFVKISLNQSLLLHEFLTKRMNAYARKREQNRTSNVTSIPLRAQSDSTGNRRQSDKSATFGQRRVSDIKG